MDREPAQDSLDSLASKAQGSDHPNNPSLDNLESMAQDSENPFKEEGTKPLLQKAAQAVGGLAYTSTIKPMVDAANIILPQNDPESDPSPLSGRTVEDYAKRTIDRVADIGSSVLAAPFDIGLGLLDKYSHVVGSSIGKYVLSGYSNMLGFDSMYDNAQYEDVKARVERQKLTGKLEDKALLEVNKFPLSLADLLRRPTKQMLDATSQWMEDEGAPSAAQGLRAVTPVVSEAAGLAAEYYGAPMPKVGNLTKEGLAAAKEGTLEQGLAQRVAKGQAKGFEAEFDIPFLGKKAVPVATQKFSQDVLFQVQNRLAEVEASKIGQQIRMFTTFPTMNHLGLAGEQLVIKQHMIKADAGVLEEAMKYKANTMGIDLGDPAKYDDWVRYAENPSHYTPKLVDKNKAESLYAELQGGLDKDVAEASAKGITIEDKFGNTNIGPYQYKNGFSERYLPRYVSKEGKALQKLMSLSQDSDEAAKLMKDLGLNKGYQKTDLSFLSRRSDINTSKLNEMVFEKTGLSNYFESDPIKAYAMKRADIRTAIQRKDFYDTVVQSAGATKLEWVKMRNAAQDRVATARANGLVPLLQDVKMSKVDLNSLQELGASGEDLNRVLNAGQVVKKDYQTLLLPKSDADFVRGLITKPEQNQVNQFMSSYMRMWKGATFFNPGFIGRNMYENYSRAMQSGVGLHDIGSAQAAYFWGKGNLAKYVDEFHSVNPNHGLASTVEESIGVKAKQEIAEAASKARGELPTITKPLDAINPINEAHKALHESMMRGNKLDNVFTQTMDKVAQNPFFKKATSINNSGEQSLKFSYFAKLRQEGYTVESAIKEANSKFISYDLMRNRVVSTQNYIPFANFMTKNLETSLSLFMKNPKGAYMWAPKGALQKSIEHWAGWDPDQVDQYKKLFGQYYSDDFMGPLLGGKDAMIKEQDAVKNFLNMWLNPDGKMSGFQTWAKLPSNYTALTALDPRRGSELVGPVVKMALALLGKDPATGMPIKEQGHPVTERLAAMADASGVNALYPNRLIDGLRTVTESQWPDMRNKMSNMGLSEDMVKTIMGGDKEYQKYNDKMEMALASWKTLLMGKATKLNVDVISRQHAMMMQTQREMISEAKNIGMRGEPVTEHVKRLKETLMSKVKDLQDLLDAKNEYEDLVDKMGGQTEALILEEDPKDEPPPDTERQDEPTPEGMKSDDDQAKLNDMSDPNGKLAHVIPPNRNPAAVSGKRTFSINDGKFSVDNNGQPIPGLSDMWNQRYQELKGKNKDTPLIDQVKGMKSIYEDAEKRDKLQGPIWNLDAIIKDAEKRGEDPHEAVKKAYEELYKNIAQTGKQDRIPAGVRK